jgi:hypothetical protein
MYFTAGELSNVMIYRKYFVTQRCVICEECHKDSWKSKNKRGLLAPQSALSFVGQLLIQWSGTVDGAVG